MTNSSLSSALKVSALAVFALLAGCGPKDGVKEYDAGIAAYGIRDLKKAEREFTASLACNPERVDTLVMLARVRLDLADLPGARAAINQAAALSDGDADVLALDGEIAYHEQDYKRALTRFGALATNAELDPAVQSLGWTGIGIVEQTCIAESATDGKRDLARIAYLRALRLDNKNPSAHYHLGLLYRDAFGYSSAALEQFDLFVRIMGEADERVQRTQRTTIPAIKEDIARRAAALPGASKRDSDASSKALQRAEIAIKKGQYKTARLEYDRAYAADVLSYPAALGLAQAWEKTDSTDFGRKKALGYYRAACNLKPGISATAAAAAELALKIGLNAAVAEFYSRAVAVNPGNISYIDGLIRALKKAGGQQKIAAAYQDYRDTIPLRRR